jgi:hypothetical protein
VKQVTAILKILYLLLLFPFEVSKGSQRKAYVKIKKVTIEASLL